MNTTDRQQAVIDYPSESELTITRDFAAPRALVFEALTRPEHVRQWYGMSADSLIVCDIDFTVGGGWHYVLDGGPGQPEHSFSGTYLEIEPPSKIVSTESYDNMPGASYHCTVTLEETDGVTTLRNHIRYPSQEWRDGHVSSGMEYGMNISYNRLEDLLAALV